MYVQTGHKQVVECFPKIVASGFEVNSPWLQNGYKKFRNAVDFLNLADYLDKKRIKSADNYGLDRSGSRVGVIPRTRKALI
jgi:hypothetical protein